MAIIPEDLPSLDARATTAYAHLFQALSEPTRLAVLQHLASGEHRVRDLVGHMGLAQSTVSKHLAFLGECGLVETRPEGRATWYSLAHPHELAAVISAAEHLLHATGTDAVLCTHLHHPPLPGGPAPVHQSPDGLPAAAPASGLHSADPVCAEAPGATTPRRDSL
ncbi:ArsR family transcriptional regulator [Kocuria tytonicola]|uniref:ArsR/SmtB family transcription factor n=1 Tax=Kocuria tytonicola TaxID=2055946 RepID=UPI000EF8EDEF|nr:metalloregulator ArsR/SmtB family transcription factor [Kocuria tytonicola]RLZ04498.1 ArsR family transcriptional regulator [Kocuria tytonicola]